ncbi:XRE family transcriptional regulator [Arthrobacter sp. H35-D1]|uniref:helix-turn-helix domain-containing protein n=1 Tax=Arthrobacter sp. H35-D1 TaxID=3046202 RepID=UPI0024BB7F48|nr:XRE family transcriptional regulator [Arthrobacter sp. H35-D1]MDJ0312564.1 XRE family transcriptional regulator [Arthrobacter sp. H35-D1]
MNDVADDDLQIASRIRAARLARSFTLTQVSARSGVSVGHLSRLENAERLPTVRVLMQLAQALGVSLTELVGESASESEVHVSLASDRNVSGTLDKSLVPLSDPQSLVLQAFELQLEPGRKGEPTCHLGEEWIYVVSGRVNVLVGSETVALGPGDATHFPASIRHCLKNPHSSPAVAVIVASTGSLPDPSAH